MSDLNDPRTERAEQAKVAHAALGEQLNSLERYLTTVTGTTATCERDRNGVRIRMQDRGQFLLRRGAVVESLTFDRAEVDRLLLDERVQSELDAIERLIDQLDSLEIRENTVDVERRER